MTERNKMSNTNDKAARTFEITAKSFEEGKAQAEADYGKEGEVSCYLLEKEKKGFLGIGAAPARIRVTVTPRIDVVGDVLRADSKNEKQADAKKPVKPETKAPDKQRRENTKEQRPDAKDAAKQQKSETKSAAKQQKNEAKDSAKQEKKETKNAVKQEKKEVKEKKERRERENIVITQNEMDVALGFINTLLENMQSEAKAVQAVAPEGAVFEGVYPRIEIVGDKSGILIGHHGETMDAIQFLANLCVNRKTGVGGKEFVKIVVDIENYREKREETLRALARRMAQKAIKTKRNVVLEPMNPYERHIIHAEIQDMENVDTHSVGSDENRKVVITYEGEDKVEHKSKNRRRGHRSNGGTERSEKSVEAKPAPVRTVSEEESAAIKEAYEAYQEEKAGRERPKRASSIDEILGGDGLF
jgi:spoIIIJ-associated protein